MLADDLNSAERLIMLGVALARSIDAIDSALLEQDNNLLPHASIVRLSGALSELRGVVGAFR